MACIRVGYGKYFTGITPTLLATSAFAHINCTHTDMQARAHTHPCRIDRKFIFHAKRHCFNLPINCRRRAMLQGRPDCVQTDAEHVRPWGIVT